MSGNVRQLLTTLGDARFAAALRALRPKVRWFHALLGAAPAIDWPVDRAIRG